jgi:hypothetical protein
LTTKRLDALGMSRQAIANKGVDLITGDAQVHATLGWDRPSRRCSQAWVLPGGFSPRARGAPE